MGLHSNLRASQTKTEDAFCEFGSETALIFAYISAFLRPALNVCSPLAPRSWMRQFACRFVPFTVLPDDWKAIWHHPVIYVISNIPLFLALFDSPFCMCYCRLLDPGPMGQIFSASVHVGSLIFILHLFYLLNDYFDVSLEEMWSHFLMIYSLSSNCRLPSEERVSWSSCHHDQSGIPAPFYLFFPVFLQIK